MSVIGHYIRAVTADADRKSLTITWDDGSVTTKSMGPLIAAKRVFRPLAEAALFSAVTIIQNGRALAWVDDIDLCADALWFDAHPDQNPFIQVRETA